MIFWKRKSPASEPQRTAAEEYAILENLYRGKIDTTLQTIPSLLDAANYEWAAKNYAMMADAHVELGVLRWRGGLDPRPDFERATSAFDALGELVSDHGLPKANHEFPILYAMLSLSGRRTSIEFEDSAFFKESRWPCYLSCIVHALHDQPLDSYRDQLLDTYLGEGDELADRTMRTYLNLLEAHSVGVPVDALVAEAEANWLKRKTSRFFADEGLLCEGHGLKNELFVDLYLSAILHKIGWDGESIHRWKW
ncbi:MAG: hypothetical protein NT015_09790 [Alphaproteobacteria bacterium]|nr:hypothetical protein [Alphaproteobacteria bacterium]